MNATALLNGILVGIDVVVPFILVISFVIICHELGHFFAAKTVKLKIEAFSLGLGPELCGRTDASGVRWRLSAVPLGGYVRFAGDQGVASAPDPSALARMSADERRRTLPGQPLLNRAWVVIAGPLANILTAVVIFSALIYLYGVTIATPRIDEVVKGSPAEAAGFRPGDLVVRMAGRPVSNFSDIANYVATRPGDDVVFEVKRKGEQVLLTARIGLAEVETPVGRQRQGRLGVLANPDASSLRVIYPNPFQALMGGAQRSWEMVAATARFVGRMAIGKAPLDALSGPVHIAQMSGAAASAGFRTLIELTAMISLSLGVVNLLPIPMLDGGHLLLYGIEAARGRPLSQKSQLIALRIGAYVVLALIVFVTLNDLWRLFRA
jgi:regulator of sigma E protease